MPSDPVVEIVVLDSVTKLTPAHKGAVAVAGSHGGVYAAYLAARCLPRGVILNDAGMGREAAGIGGLDYLDALGIAAATVAHTSARIGDGADMMAGGLVSHVNAAAARLGCVPGQGVAECARRMQAGEVPGALPGPLAESRLVLRDVDGLAKVVGLDSLSLLKPEDAGAIVICASHGGVLAGHPDGGKGHEARAITFCDAGLGKDGAGITRLAALDEHGVPAVAVSAESARIGDARSVHETGVVSHANAAAQALGVATGDSVRRFVDLVTEAALEPSAEEVLALYERAQTIRAFETQAIRALKEGLAFGPLHSSEGQEAIATGVCSALERRDRILSTHRGHGHAIAKGADVPAMMAEIYGRATGTCSGKGGSMHIADFAVGMLGANGVVSANINIAAGVAHGLKLLGEDAVTVCFFGDGAANRGPFLEGLNWAQVYGLRVLFVCEDNGFSATTRTSPMTAGPGIEARAEALGVPVSRVDGNDLAAVVRAARRLVATMRGEARPRLLLARTYRFSGHTVTDPAAYRPSAEVAEKRGDDPLPRCAAWLATHGIGANRIAAAEAAAEEAVARAAAAAAAAPWPERSALHADVQDAGSPVERAF